MGFLIGVEIDSSRIVWILDSERQKSGKIRLTTVSENQNKAIIRFYIKSSGKKNLIYTEKITGIPPMPAGEPSIDIKASVSGGSLNHQIYLNEKPLNRRAHNINKYTRSFKPFLIIAAIAVLCAAAAAIFILLPKIGTSDILSGQSSSVDVREQKDPEKTVAPDTKEETIQTTTTTKSTSITESTAATSTEKQTKTESPTENKPLPVEPIFIESEITDRHSVYFQPDSAVLTIDAISDLGNFINRLPKENDFDEGLFEVEIRGHCARYGTEEGREELSRERAIIVFDFLKAEWKLEADSVISGAGASEPVTLKRDEQYLNRRVDINIRGSIKKIETSD